MSKMEQQERQEALEIGEKLGSEPIATGAASTDQEPNVNVDSVVNTQQPGESDEEDDITKDTYRSFEVFLPSVVDRRLPRF